MEQERVYDGRKHCHCHGVTVLNKNLDVYTKIFITDIRSDHDRRVYTQTPPYVSPLRNISPPANNSPPISATLKTGPSACALSKKSKVLTLR